MREVKFTKAAPGACPSYGEYYIQDRPYGRDIHGNECYQYALYRKRRFETLRRFRTRKQAYQYLSNRTGTSRWDIQYGSYSIIVNDRDYLGILHGSVMYRLNKRSREIQTRPAEDERVTVWYDKLNECIAEAKQIITEMEDEQLEGQLDLLGGDAE